MDDVDCKWSNLQLSPYRVKTKRLRTCEIIEQEIKDLEQLLKGKDSFW
jgi:hypothetical protein